MKLTKILACALAAATVMGFMSCTKKSANGFVLGLDDAFPPMGFRNEKNEIVGYDIDLAKEVCKRLDLQFTAQPIDWAAKEQELNTGKISCIWNGLTITEERKAALCFSDPYLNNAQVIVVKADSGYKSLGDLAGKSIGVQAGSSAADAINDSPDFKSSVAGIIEFRDNITALNDLEIGGVAGVVMDKVVANYSIKTTGKPFVLLTEELSPELYGIAFKKDNVELRDKVQKTLNEMAADGTVAKISEKWFGSDISVIGK